MFLVVKENLPTQKLPIFSAGAQRAVDVVVAAKHVSDAILGVRGIGLGRVTKRRGGGGGGGGGKERARKTLLPLPSRFGVRPRSSTHPIWWPNLALENTNYLQ